MKKTNYTRLLVIFFVIFLWLFQTKAHAQLLKVSGQKIVNSSTDQEVLLNAMNFGNWQIMEGYMMNSVSQAPDQHTWKSKLTSLMGSDKVATFYDAWLKNFVTREDIKQVKAWGFNSVRLPLHYEYFINSGTPDVWNPKGFAILDSVITWCREEGIYAVIDLHAAPGGQNSGDISDYDSTKPSLWESETNKTKTVKLWRKLSEIYKDEPYVAGYDLLNEPAWDLPNGTDLRDLYGRLTDTIRADGDQHILFIEGNWYANDYTGLTPAWDANMVYVFHKYWSSNHTSDIQWVLDLRRQQNRPIWCGEQGENSNHLFTRLTELLQTNDIGMSWWPMKKFESINDFADAKWADGYMDVLNYLGGTNSNLSPDAAFNTMMQMAENVKLQNCTIHNEVLRSIFTQPGNRETEPFTTHNIPGRVYAPNYDQGMNGYAYSDQQWANYQVTTGIYTAWNNGWAYRNNGVDIEQCTDSLSNGYDVGWLSAGEWMQYTCQVDSAGTYTIEFRAANGSSGSGKIQIQNSDGTEALATVDIPQTGGWTQWKTVQCVGGFSQKGTRKIRIVDVSGTFNLASVNFIYENNTIPDAVPVVRTDKIIYLKGSNDKYVTYSADNGLLTCTKSTLGNTETFTLVDAGNGFYALKGYNGKYVTLNSSDNKLYCSSSTIGENEKLRLTDLCGVYSIQGANNMFVSSENGDTGGMTCTRTSPQGWEFFNWGFTNNPLETAVLSIRDGFSNEFNVFPNPARNFINITSRQEDPVIVNIYNMSGRAVMQTSLNSHQKHIDIHDIPNGMYVIKLIGKNNSNTLKFLKVN